MVERCPFCGGSSEASIEAREMMFGLRTSFTYRRCDSCASLWLTDPPDSLDGYYGEGYYSIQGHDPKGTTPIPGAARWAAVLVRLPVGVADRLAGKRGFPWYSRWIAGLGLDLSSRIADVGSGEGHLVFQMARHGFREVWGFDPHIAADLDLGAARLRRAEFGDAEGNFALVMFNHALEHVHDPVGALCEAAQHLTPDGAILVRIPLAGSFADLHYGPDWVALDPPRHLAIPSQAGMRCAAAKAGLTVSRTFFDSSGLQFWASEQYARDIPLNDGRGGCEAATLKVLNRRADALNRTGEGDTVGFILRRPL